MNRFVLAFLLAFVSMPPAYAETSRPVTVCFGESPVSWLGFVARAKDYFREEGIEARYVSANNAKICQDYLTAGKAEVMLGADVPYNYFAYNNPPLILAAQLGQFAGVAAYARKDAGIANMADLKGKRIGYLPGTSSYIYLLRLLDKIGLTQEDVKLSVLQPPAMPQALVGSMVDAIVIWEPWGDLALKTLGDKAVRLHDPALYAQISILMVSRDWAAHEPETLQGILRALLKAEQFTLAHPEEAREMVAKDLKLDPAVLAAHAPDYHIGVNLGETLVRHLEANARTIGKYDPNFKDKSLPDFRSYIDPSFLKSVAPDRVEKGL